MIRFKKLKGLDLSFSKWKPPGQFIMCEVLDCLFTSADLRTNIGKSFQQCSFEGANLARAVVRGSYEECSFENAKLANVGSSVAQFRRCSFAGADLRKAHFQNCEFEACNFGGARFAKGSIAGSRFIDCELDQSSLGDTLVERVRWS